MIYQKSTVMTQYLIKDIQNSPILSPAFLSNLTPSAALTGSFKKGYQSVTHYLRAQLPPCVNHKKRKSVCFSDISEEGQLYFCKRCKESLERQGFVCKNTDEFNRSNNSKKNIFNQQPNLKKIRKNRLDTFLMDIKAIHDRANHFQDNFEEIIYSELSENSKHITALFQEVEKAISLLKQVFQQQIQQSSQVIFNSYTQLKCALTWTQEELQYMIGKISKSSHWLILDEDFYSTNMKILTESLQEKEKKIVAAEQTFRAQYQRFRKDKNNRVQEITTILANMKCLLSIKDMNGVISFDSSQGDPGKMFRQILGEISTNNNSI